MPEIQVITEFSPGLGRRIPYENEGKFSGIVNFQFVTSSESRGLIEPYKTNMMKVEKDENAKVKAGDDKISITLIKDSRKKKIFFDMNTTKSKSNF